MKEAKRRYLNDENDGVCVLMCVQQTKKNKKMFVCVCVCVCVYVCVFFFIFIVRLIIVVNKIEMLFQLYRYW